MARNRALAERLGLSYRLLADPDRAVMRAFGVEAGEIARPAIFVVGRDREVVWRWLSDSYRERIPAADVVRALDAIPR